MNRQFVLTIIVVTAICAGTTAFPQQHRPYNEIMKDVGATFASLKKNLDANSGTTAAEDAARLQRLFAETEAFWASLDTGDAVGFAKRAREAAAALGAAARGNDIKAAQVTYTVIQKSCANCHFSHREETGKGFLIRP
jgi:hypothetical protein